MGTLGPTQNFYVMKICRPIQIFYTCDFHAYSFEFVRNKSCYFQQMHIAGNDALIEDKKKRESVEKERYGAIGTVVLR